jgi:hypothetical protein
VLGSGGGGGSAAYSLLYNPDFRVATRGTSFTNAGHFPNNDGSYLLDGAVLLSDGNNIANVAQELSTVPLGAYAAAKLTVATANKKFGLFFPIEANDAKQIIGGVASLSFKARKGGSNATLGTLRAAIVSWSGAEDAITRDVVSGTSWGAAGTNPTLAANWTYENAPSNLTLTSSYQEFKIENVAIDTASTRNVGVFIWTDDANATVNDIIFLADINFVSGAIATSYSRGRSRCSGSCARASCRIGALPRQAPISSRLATRRAPLTLMLPCLSSLPRGRRSLVSRSARLAILP